MGLRAMFVVAASSAAICLAGSARAAAAADEELAPATDSVAVARREPVAAAAPQPGETAQAGAGEAARPAPPSRAVYNYPRLPAAKGSAPRLDWGTDAPLAVPEPLLEAIRIVTARDASARAAWMDARAANSAVASARWLSYPALVGDMNLSSGPNRVLPTLTVDMPIWAGGRIKSTIKRARHAESSAVAKWQEVVQSLALQVNDVYFQVVQATSLEALYQKSLEDHRALVQTMERRVQQEISPQADLDLARSRAAQIEQELTFISSQREAGLRSLAQLIQDPDFDLGNAPTFNPSRLAEDWSTAEDEAVDYSPSRWRLIYDANAARDLVDQTRSSLFPRVSAQYTYNEITGSRIGLGLRMQTSNGLAQFSDISAASARQESAENQIRLFERQLRQDISAEVVSQAAALARAEVSSRAQETAASVSQSYVRQFIAGRRSWLDVMNSLREYLTAQSGLLQAQITAMSTSVRLNIRTGRWNPEPAATGE